VNVRRLQLDVDKAVQRPDLLELAEEIDGVPGVEAVIITVPDDRYRDETLRRLRPAGRGPRQAFPDREPDLGIGSSGRGPRSSPPERSAGYGHAKASRRYMRRRHSGRAMTTTAGEASTLALIRHAKSAWPDVPDTGFGPRGTSRTRFCAPPPAAPVRHGSWRVPHSAPIRPPTSTAVCTTPPRTRFWT
jgi:hypothetical protein